MRRPVKPFVTEYKGLNRRPPQQTNAANRRSSEDAMASLSPNDVFSRNGSDHAALAPSPQPHGNHANHSEDTYEAALRAADALFAPAPQQAGASARTRDVQAGDDAVDPADPSALPGRGRILRVLEEKPAPDPSDMDAEDAPKRRGRKPGSKNKPREGLPAAPKARPAFEPAHFIFNHAEPSDAIDASANHKALAEPAPRQRTTRAVPAQTSFQRADRGPAAGDDGARSEPFGWIRVKLAPGERWKRRLPKVCW